jgi:hypothetical protein
MMVAVITFETSVNIFATNHSEASQKAVIFMMSIFHCLRYNHRTFDKHDVSEANYSCYQINKRQNYLKISRGIDHFFRFRVVQLFFSLGPRLLLSLDQSTKYKTLLALFLKANSQFYLLLTIIIKITNYRNVC